MKKHPEQTGFALIEALVAITVLTIGILSLYSMQVSAIQGNSSASQITTSATAGTNQLEAIFAADYDDPLMFLDKDNDAVGGLYDFTDATADGRLTTLDGYTIYWNVANDTPMPFTRRIVVNVVRTERGTRKNVEYEYIKAQKVKL